MAQALSVEVIAEGVEHERQLHALRELGCQLAQGDYLSHPLSVSAAGALLEGGGAPAVARAQRAISMHRAKGAVTLSR